MQGKKVIKPKSFRGPNRREYPRFEYPFYMSYKKNGEEFKKEFEQQSTPFYFREKKDEKLSVSKNISVGGICFVTREKFLPGVKLSVKLWSPIAKKTLIALVEVKWQKSMSFTTCFLTGVAFISLDDKQELRKVLELFTDLKLEEMIVR